MVFIKLFKHLLKKQKQKLSSILKKYIVLLLLFVVSSSLLIPIFAKAESGDTAYGKWYDATDIKLRTEIDVMGSDGVWQPNTNFIRIGNEPGKSYFKVRLRVYLDSPNTLTFAGDQWAGSPVRDGVKAPDKNGAFGGKNIYGLVGIGSAWGLKENVSCEYRDARAFWRFWASEQVAFCWDHKLGEDKSKSNDKKTDSITYTSGGPGVGGIYQNENIGYIQKDFESLGMIGPTSGDYRVFDFKVWPQLVVNTEDVSLSDYVIAGVEGRLAQGAAEKTLLGVKGITAKSLEVFKKYKDKLLSGDFAAKEEAIAEVAAAATTAGSEIPSAQIRVLAEESLEFAKTMSATQSITADVIQQAINNTVQKLVNKGMTKELALSLAQEHVGQVAAGLGESAPKLLGASGQILETAAAKVVATEAEKVIAKATARTVAKAATGLLARGALKFLPIIGWAWTIADIAVYVTSFKKGEITYYNGNTHDVFIQVFDTEAAALAQKGESPPAGVNIDGGAKVSGGQNPTNGKNSIATLINEIIGTIVQFIQYTLYSIFSFLIAPLISALLSIHPYKDSFVAVIYPGWIVVRNICNIFFILALIIIAMATLFRIEAYQYKHLIVQLIIAALLINFSLVIAQAILGLADTVQAQFLGNNVTAINTLAKNLMVNNNSSLFNTALTNANAGTVNGSLFIGTMQNLFWLALTIGSFCVFSAIAVFLFIRIVALWVLLLVSPIAYAAGVLPSTAGYRGTWWQNFLKYAFFTPIMAFFLNLTVVMVSNAKNNAVLQDIINSSNITSAPGIANLVIQIGSNVLILIFLLAGIKVAEQSGTLGAGKIAEWAQKGLFSPFGAAGFGAKVAGGYAGRRWNEITSNIRGDKERINFGRAAAYAVLNPVAFVKGIKKQSEERVHRAQAKAEAVGLEVAEQRFSSPKAFFKGSYKISPHVLQHEKEEEDEQAKKLQNLSREEVARRAAQIFHMGNDEEGKAYKRGVIKLAMSKGYIDDIVQEAHKTQEGRDMIEEMLKMEDLKEGEDYKMVPLTKKDEHGHDVPVMDSNGKPKMVKAMEYNHATRRAMYKAMFGWDGHAHLKDHAAMRLITQEGEAEGMATGHLEYMTDMRVNEETGEFEFYKLSKDKNGGWVSAGEEQMAGKEIAKKDSRTQARIAWHSLLSSNGKSFSKAVFARISKAIAENPGFMQERQANKLITGYTDGDIVDKNIESLTNDNIIRVSENMATVLKEMESVDEKATATLLQRFLNDSKNDESIKSRIKKGVIIETGEWVEKDGKNVFVKSGSNKLEFKKAKLLVEKQAKARLEEVAAKDPKAQ
jgi:hypothetical protein